MSRRLQDQLKITPLAIPQTSIPKTRWGRWLQEGDAIGGHKHPIKKPWYEVLWLTGVDYFSTLGYQPGLALLAAGALAPVATLVLILVTLFCALPVYSQVAKRSFAGSGSLAMLEKLLSGWSSKIFVLVLLGFAATDFIITITLSAADAALHLIQNPYWQLLPGTALIPHANILLTLVLITLLAAVFLKGFSEAIGIAKLIAVPYILLNIVVLTAGLFHVFANPEKIHLWRVLLHAHGSPVEVALLAVFVFPKLALGMSGFETGVSVMPLIAAPEDGREGDALPQGRITNTRKLLISAAVMMSILLLMSSFVTAILVPESAFQPGGPAAGRTISYLAHELLGWVFGSVYDFSTILVLWFAGASAMAGMLNMIPHYLPRFGMAPHWVEQRRPLVLVIFLVSVAVTIFFRASVEAQGGAYATGVLALMLSAATAVTLAKWHESRSAGRGPSRSTFYFAGVVLVFAYTFIDNAVLKPEGLVIAATFVTVILILAIFNRSQRAYELRVNDITLADAASAELWNDLIDKKVNLVPMARVDEHSRTAKFADLRDHYRLNGPVAYLHVKLKDNRSDFLSELTISVRRISDQEYCIAVSGGIAIANTIAYVSELINPISLYIGLTRANLTNQAFRYLISGEGETGLLVYRILLRYWDWTPEEDVRPLIFLMSE